MFQSPISSKWYSFVDIILILILILIIRMLISIITPLPTFAKNPVSTTKMHRRKKKKKKQVYEKRPGNDADDIDISEVSENSKPFGITVSLYQYV